MAIKPDAAGHAEPRPASKHERDARPRLRDSGLYGQVSATFDHHDPGSDLVLALAAEARRRAGHDPAADPDTPTLSSSELQQLTDALLADVEDAEGAEATQHGPPQPGHFASALQHVRAERARQRTQ